jgi:hypothetical protein
MDMFERKFFKVLKEEMTASSALGGSEGLEGGSVGNTDSYAPGDNRIPKSIFGGTLTRSGITKCKKCKKGKKCEACKRKEKKVVSENTGADTNWEDGDVKITLKDILDYSSEPQEKDPRAFEELLINVSRDPNRVDRADLGYPIVVSSKGGKPTKILDGQHRIVKAIKYNQPILVRYLDLDRAPEHFQQMFN